MEVNKRLKIAAGIVASSVGVALLVSAAVMISKYSDDGYTRSITEATNKILDSREKVESVLNEYNLVSSYIAGEVSKSDSVVSTLNILTASLDNNDYKALGLTSIKFFNGEKCYSESGGEFTLSNDLALAYRQQETQEVTYLGMTFKSVSEYTEEYGLADIHQFYAPVYNNDFADGILLEFTDTNFIGKIGTSFVHNEAEISSLVVRNEKGNILSSNPGIGMSLRQELIDFFGPKTVADQTYALLLSGESGSIEATYAGIKYVLVVETHPEVMKDLAIVELYECSELIQSTQDLIDAIIAIIIIFTVIVLMIVGYLVYRQIKLNRLVANKESMDIALNCLNRHGFEKEAEGILQRQGDLYYGVIVAQLKHFKFIKESFGEAELNSLLRYLKNEYTRICKVEETFGRIENGEFLLLLHAKDKEALIERLKILAYISSKYKGKNKFDVNIKYGIYESKGDSRTTISKMIDYALEANNSANSTLVGKSELQFNFYDDELRKIRLIHEDMELRQDSALNEGEFEVFYQPKYNLNTKRQDGAEALVRWYDKKENDYVLPSLFIPLFESNGFIIKLDHYVYQKVCEYISYSLQHREPIYPISVNVSRITAVQPDFIDFMVKMKKKYGISNKTITIEFTESFAFENYEVLQDIVNKLHKAGFLCSIDDFGSGYSSYRILKELPMDEIKLDKFFIDKTSNADRIEYIYDSVIMLAKNLKMKVTQEGVEDIGDVEFLKQHGCDVIQGFIYSTPIKLNDYLTFVNHSKEHNL